MRISPPSIPTFANDAPNTFLSFFPFILLMTLDYAHFLATDIAISSLYCIFNLATLPGDNLVFAL